MNRFSQGAVYNLQGDGEITPIANKTGEHVLQYTNCDYHLPSEHISKPFLARGLFGAASQKTSSNRSIQLIKKQSS
jgi:hypothetical protein